jgi:hypothetical protein
MFLLIHLPIQNNTTCSNKIYRSSAFTFLQFNENINCQTKAEATPKEHALMEIVQGEQPLGE